MHPFIEKTIQELQATPGLANVCVLGENDKKLIAALEEKENKGVHACLAKSITLALTHDSQFRNPAAPIVLKQDEGYVFPPVPFPEVKHAVSSSPSRKVHDFLVNLLNIHTNEKDATLLIGFDVKDFK